MAEHYKENRPWGSFEILSQFNVDEPGFFDVCVKKLIIHPGKRVSYQAHKQRAEHWFFTQGKGKVILNGRKILVAVGSFVDIKIGDRHRVINTSENQNLIFIECQTGHYDENDIERFEDDYGRA